MSHASWVIDQTTLSVRLMSGEVTISSDAMQVWMAQFEGITAINGYVASPPSKDLPEVTFHDEVGQLRLQIRRTPSKQHVLVPVVAGSSSEYSLRDIPTSSQVLSESNWFALDQNQCAAIRAVLKEQGILPYSELTDQQVLWLTWKSGLDVTFSAEETREVTAKASVPFIRDSSVKAELYPYQAQGVERLWSLYGQGLGCLLADEMGLGKTLQVITLIAAVQARGPSLVVGPASTLANWAREFSRFAPSIHVHTHQGPTRTGRPSSLGAVDVVVTSYETLVQDFTLFAQVDWNIIALDEAQAIKNPASKRAIAARQLGAGCRIAVTGTPIENSLRDLWAIMEFVASAYLPPFEEFQALYPDETWAAEQLGKLVAPLVIRRNVYDVATDLPDRVDALVPLIMPAQLATEYNSIRQGDKSVLAKMTALRVCAASATASVGSSKIGRLVEIAEEAFSSGKKVLVFSSFTDSIDQIASGFRGTYGLYVGTLDGRTSVNNRQKIIDEYSSHAGPGILILNPRAAGVGLNIQAANYVIHFTPEWNPAVVDQASARSYRRGQVLPVFVYYLYYEETIESIMVERLYSKRELQRSGLLTTKEGPDENELEKILKLAPKESIE